MSARLFIGIAAGAIVGLAYQRLVGCASGRCPITSNPWAATIYGAVLGGLVAVA